LNIRSVRHTRAAFRTLSSFCPISFFYFFTIKKCSIPSSKFLPDFLIWMSMYSLEKPRLSAQLYRCALTLRTGLLQCFMCFFKETTTSHAHEQTRCFHFWFLFNSKLYKLNVVRFLMCYAILWPPIYSHLSTSAWKEKLSLLFVRCLCVYERLLGFRLAIPPFFSNIV
jgi:hypothetical protein